MKCYSFLWPLYVSEFLKWSGFTFPIWILFFQSRGLSLTEIGFATSGIFLASILLEYPTGIFADKFGRKKSLFISLFFYVLSLFIELNAKTTIEFFIGCFMGGVSMAFASGAREAFIYDSLKSRGLQKLNSKVLGNFDILITGGLVLSTLAGPSLYSINKTLPYWISILITIIAAVALLFLKEDYIPKIEKTETREYFKDSIAIVFKNPVIFSLLLLYIFLFFFEQAWYNSYQPTILELGLHLSLLGLYVSSTFFARAIGGYILPKIIGTLRHRTFILIIILFEALVWIMLGTNSLAAVITFSIFLSLIRQFFGYIDADIVHKHIPSSIRATTLSAREMVISIIFIFNPWFMGYLLDAVSRTTLFMTFGIIILVISGAVFFLRKKYL